MNKNKENNLNPTNYPQALIDSMVDSLHETADFLKQKYEAIDSDLGEIFDTLELHRSWAEGGDECFEKLEDELKSVKKEIRSLKFKMRKLG